MPLVSLWAPTDVSDGVARFGTDRSDRFAGGGSW